MKWFAMLAIVVALVCPISFSSGDIAPTTPSIVKEAKDLTVNGELIGEGTRLVQSIDAETGHKFGFLYSENEKCVAAVEFDPPTNHMIMIAYSEVDGSFTAFEGYNEETIQGTDITNEVGIKLFELGMVKYKGGKVIRNGGET